MKDILRKLFRHVCYQTIPNDDPFMEFDCGDEFFAPSICFNVKWNGNYYWHCFFIPWLPNGK